MGLDWIPCRLEPDVDVEVARAQARQEYEQFIVNSGHVPFQLYPLAGRNPFVKSQAGTELSRSETCVSDLLLVKCYSSHRVSVISRFEILPPKWRLESLRTIFPDELAATVSKWQDYLNKVRQGGYRPFLEEVLLYVSTVDLGLAIVEVIAAVNRSCETSATWATRAETCEVRDQILGFPEPAIAAVPSHDFEMNRRSDFDERLHRLIEYRDQFSDLVSQWNAATRRGNWRFTHPPSIPDIESWIAEWLNNEWFATFVEWTEPLIQRGYGLYRDEELY